MDIKKFIIEDGEELIECENYEFFCWRNKKGQIHRKIGPAIIYKSGKYTAWYLNGKKHRIDGPAIRYNGASTEEWWQYGKLHRKDGPARQYFGNQYFLKGKALSKNEFLKIITIKRIKKINANTRKNKQTY